MHGANATGRPFTGDFAGILLYETLHRFGFASAAQSVAADDSLRLLGCRITNAVKCLPPQNKPTGDEIDNCRAFLRNELAAFGDGGVVIALGAIAHRSIVGGLGLRHRDFAFAHGAEHGLPRGMTLIDSYHCSRYNTQTRRLTPEMFAQVFARARTLLG
jgi:uracil-DNA glycosylase family 4